MKGSTLNILITGGAGFIGSHTVDLLIKRGHNVTILDNLEPQVHGHVKRPPSYLNKRANFTLGDLKNKKLLPNMIKNQDAIIHLAAQVGVGQSMYHIEKYIDDNTKATATLLDLLVNSNHNVKKLVVASSMSIYGEGSYACKDCGVEVNPKLRTEQQLEKKEWEPKCPSCNRPLQPAPTKESKPLYPTSIYAQSKRHQEEMALLIGKTYGIPTIALRYFNVYGTRQSQSNPYTGVCAIFSSRIINNNPPMIFEDGQQKRDFMYIGDLANANLKALETSKADYQIVNIGSGKPISIIELAEALLRLYGSSQKPQVTQKYRKGDIRHCYAETTKAKKMLDFQAQKPILEGLKEIVEWTGKQDTKPSDKFDKAYDELESRGLTSK